MNNNESTRLNEKGIKKSENNISLIGGKESNWKKENAKKENADKRRNICFCLFMLNTESTY